jgi:ABC-type transport system involved in cytochrome bd biosynthesis fused ATPase/permease subunit
VVYPLFGLATHPPEDKVIGPNGLLGKKARILVTNNLAYLSQTDSMLLMRSGVILEESTYDSVDANPQSELFKFM